MKQEDIQSLIRSFNMVNKKYTLNKQDFQKIGKGALIAVGGALATYLVQMIGQVDFGEYTPVIVAVGSILINAITKYLSGDK